MQGPVHEKQLLVQLQLQLARVRLQGLVQVLVQDRLQGAPMWSSAWAGARNMIAQR